MSPWTPSGDVVFGQPLSASEVNAKVRDNLIFLREETERQITEVSPVAVRLAKILAIKPRWDSTPTATQQGQFLTTNALGLLEPARQIRHLDLRATTAGGDSSLTFSEGTGDEAAPGWTLSTGSGNYAIWSFPRSLSATGRVYIRVYLNDYRHRQLRGIRTARVRWGFQLADQSFDWRGDAFNHTYTSTQIGFNWLFGSVHDLGWNNLPSGNIVNLVFQYVEFGGASIRIYGISLDYEVNTDA